MSVSAKRCINSDNSDATPLASCDAIGITDRVGPLTSEAENPKMLADFLARLLQALCLCLRSDALILATPIRRAIGIDDTVDEFRANAADKLTTSPSHLWIH